MRLNGGTSLAPHCLSESARRCQTVSNPGHEHSPVRRLAAAKAAWAAMSSRRAAAVPKRGRGDADQFALS